MGRMERHTVHLRNEVRMKDIEEAYDARRRELESLAKLEDSNRRQEYSAMETAVNPKFYRDRLSYLRNRVCEGTGAWLVQDPEVAKWLRATKGHDRVIWLRGIPGAGAFARPSIFSVE